MTFTYRLYQFENALGEAVWQAKEPLFLGLWTWLRYGWMHEGAVRQWDTREAALKWLREHSQKQLDKVNASVRAGKRGQLKLVVIEPVEIKP